MKRRLNLKIYGESPRSLILAFILSKLKCDIYIYEFLESSNSKKDYQTFLFSNSSKTLFSKFDIWNEIEEISYGFTSLSIKDNMVSEKILLRNDNSSINNLNIIGWTANYYDIRRLLINKLIENQNVHFISNKQLIDESLIFDYEFNFNNYDKILKLFKSPLKSNNRIDDRILIFNVYLRGNVEKRLYEINTSKGLLVLIPLSKNLYQIIWNYSSLGTKENPITSKSFFLDNLTTLLPGELKVDQIIDSINYLSVNNIFSTYLIKNKSIYFNENKFKSNTIYDFNFDVIIKYVLKIYNFLEKNKSSNIMYYNKFGFYYLLRKYVEIIINFSFFNFLFYLFKVNNLYSLFLRKILFTLFKKINLIRIFVKKNLNIYNINNLLK